MFDMEVHSSYGIALMALLTTGCPKDSAVRIDGPPQHAAFSPPVSPTVQPRLLLCSEVPPTVSATVSPTPSADGFPVVVVTGRCCPHESVSFDVRLVQTPVSEGHYECLTSGHSDSSGMYQFNYTYTGACGTLLFDGEAPGTTYQHKSRESGATVDISCATDTSTDKMCH